MLKYIVALILVAYILAARPTALSATSADTSGASGGQGTLRSEFQSRLDAWLAARDKWIGEHPYASFLEDLPEQQAIVEMGPSVVPFCIDMFDEEIAERKWDNRLQADIVGILTRITWKGFPKSEWPSGTYGRHSEAMRLYVKWWKEGRKKTPEQFAKLYADWDKQVKEGKTAEAEKTLDLMRRMGIEILPLIMKKIEQGDERLVTFVNKLLRKEVLEPNADRKAALGWWKANEAKHKFPDPPADAPKTAPKCETPTKQ